VDRQDFEAVEAYGVERWLGELALALSVDGGLDPRLFGGGSILD